MSARVASTGRKPAPNRESLLAAQAGLVSLLLLSVTFATFGPWFSLDVAHALMVGSIVAALVGLYWAHQTSHALRNRPGEGGRAFAHIGTWTSLAAVLGSLYATGFLPLLLHPVFWTFSLPVFVVFLVLHEERCREQDASGRALWDPDWKHVCVRCGAPMSGETHWLGDGWRCELARQPRRASP